MKYLQYTKEFQLLSRINPSVTKSLSLTLAHTYIYYMKTTTRTTIQSEIHVYSKFSYFVSFISLFPSHNNTIK